MALKRFKVPQKPTTNIFFGSLSWRANYDGNGTIVFVNPKMKRGGHITITNVNPGDEIGFNADGPNSRAFKVKAPVDLKYHIMWKYGFTKPKRITHWFSCGEDHFPGFKKELEYNHPGDYYRNSYGVFTLDWDIKYVTVKDRQTGEILIETARGRFERSNSFMDSWYMSPNATLQDVEEWERKYLEVNKDD